MTAQLLAVRLTVVRLMAARPTTVRPGDEASVNGRLPEQ
jgi:hypothetical protein